jgi:uncharacterized membrane protein
MLIFWIIVVSILMMGIFLAATIAGGRAHDRHNREQAKKDAERSK